MFVKPKPWYSEEIINKETGGREGNLPLSQSGSSSSLCVSPLMSRADLEQFEFFIPKPAVPTKQISVPREPQLLGQLDVSQYLTTDEAQQLKENGVHVVLGEVKFCMAYCRSTERLKVILKSVDISQKPSPTVVGINWACDPITTIELYPNDKRKANEMTFGCEDTLDVKNNDLINKALRLSIYDSRRKHIKLPIGHVILPLRDVQNIDKMNIYSKKISFYSQPAGFHKGNLVISISWSVTAQKLEIKIGKGTNLKSAYGTEGKEHYVKITSYISGAKHKSFKTQMVKATPDINFREKFVLSLNSPQLKDSSIVFRLYMKHTSKKMILSKILTGRTVIGPYMKRAARSLSQWEKIITTPVEEITEVHTLYL